MTFRNYNKLFPSRKSLAHLYEYIEIKRKNGWEVVGEIKQNYNGEYCCMMQRLDSEKGA